MPKIAKSYEVGSYQDKVGFTVTYEDGHREHQLFSPQNAVRLGELLMQVGKAAQVTVTEDNTRIGLAQTLDDQPLYGHSDKVGISDHVSVGLSTPEEKGESYENGKKKIH